MTRRRAVNTAAAVAVAVAITVAAPNSGHGTTTDSLGLGLELRLELRLLLEPAVVGGGVGVPAVAGPGVGALVRVALGGCAGLSARWPPSTRFRCVMGAREKTFPVGGQFSAPR